MAYPPIQVVDEDDRPLYGAGLEKIHADGLLHRIVAVFVQDNQGNLLLQKRGPNVSVYQNCWDFSAGGHVDEGEDYEFAAKRELAEELGIITDSLLELLGTERRSSKVGQRTLNRFFRAYKLVVPNDIDITIEPFEVAEVKWFTQEDINRLATAEPQNFSPDFIELLSRYYHP